MNILKLITLDYIKRKIGVKSVSIILFLPFFFFLVFDELMNAAWHNLDFHSWSRRGGHNRVNPESKNPFDMTKQSFPQIVQ